MLKIKQIYLSSCSQTFQKMKGGTNISYGTNILSFYTLVLCDLLRKIKHCDCMINVKITFMYVILKINQVNISSASQILQKLLEELISEG